MLVRRISPEEHIVISKMQTIAFSDKGDFDLVETDAEKFKEGYESAIGVFNDKGKLCSSVYLIPYEMRFNGNTVKMAGIGGVATLPEERNKGYIKELFRYCFKEMLENNQIFSVLYPFSNAYYRQFGYEWCIKSQSVKIPLKSFSHFSMVGEVKLYSNKEDKDIIKKIYAEFIENKNLSVVRNEKIWDKLLDKDPYKTRQYTYVYFNNIGKPMSYIVFEITGDIELNIKVVELVWLDYESLTGIFGFIKCFYPQLKFFMCSIPEFINIHLLFPEPYDIKSELLISGMNRIVNLQKVFKLLSFPEKQGQIAIKVKDSFIEGNNGTFLLTWSPKGIEVVKKECTPDLFCTIEVLTQMITGCATLEDFIGSNDLQVYGKKSLLSLIFQKKQVFINDFF